MATSFKMNWSSVMFKFIFLLVIFIQSFALAESKTITLVADPWCPWNCEDKSNPGIAVEVAKAIYEPLGYEVLYVPMSWFRAIEEVNNGTYTGLIGADKSIPEVKDFIFPETAFSHFDDVYVLKLDSNFSYKDISSLKGKSIGIVANYHFLDEIGKYIEDNYNNPKIISQVTGVNGVEQNLKKLINGRIDMYLDDRAVILYNAKKLGIRNQIKVGGEIKEDLDHYIVFSPKLSESRMLAKIYDEGIKKLKISGEYQRIIKKYME